MKNYTVKGLYNSYDKNHKERDALDYYATPTEEVVNILEQIQLDLDNSVILEPCVGGGHMVKGIQTYLADKQMSAAICGTDIQNRGYQDESLNSLQYGLDFLSDEYNEHLIVDIDYIIMNPPYATIEPFVMKALSIANKGILMLGRLQFLEGQSRYENILKDYPPTDIYIYVDRIRCYKNGNPNENTAAAQAYAWFYWDLECPMRVISKAEPIDLTSGDLYIDGVKYNSQKVNSTNAPMLHWIRRSDKKKKLIF